MKWLTSVTRVWRAWDQAGQQHLRDFWEAWHSLSVGAVVHKYRQLSLCLFPQCLLSQCDVPCPVLAAQVYTALSILRSPLLGGRLKVCKRNCDTNVIRWATESALEQRSVNWRRPENKKWWLFYLICKGAEERRVLQRKAGVSILFLPTAVAGWQSLSAHTDVTVFHAVRGPVSPTTSWSIKVLSVVLRDPWPWGAGCTELAMSWLCRRAALEGGRDSHESGPIFLCQEGWGKWGGPDLYFPREATSVAEAGGFGKYEGQVFSWVPGLAFLLGSPTSCVAPWLWSDSWLLSITTVEDNGILKRFRGNLVTFTGDTLKFDCCDS